MATIVNISAKFESTGNVSGQALGFTPTVGNHLVLCLAAWVQGTQGITTVASAGNTWNEDAEAISTASGNGYGSIWSCKVAQATSTVDVTFAGTTNMSAEWGVLEINGLDATTHKDQAGTNIGGTTGDATVTATGANTTTTGIAIAVASVGSTDTDLNLGDSPPTGYTIIDSGADPWLNEDANATQGFLAVRKIYSGSETSSVAFTHDNVGQTEWAACIVTYKDAGGGPPPITDGPALVTTQTPLRW